MHSTDELPASDVETAAARSSRSPVSVALLAAIACVPIVIATGFLADRSLPGSTAATLPGDISALALRGEFDAAPDRKPALPIRAGY